MERIASVGRCAVTVTAVGVWSIEMHMKSTDHLQRKRLKTLVSALHTA